MELRRLRARGAPAAIPLHATAMPGASPTEPRVKAAHLDQLHVHLERDAPAPVYLLAGQEPLLLLEAADAVRAAARRHGYGEREVLEAGESGFDWGALAATAQQGSLFGGNRKLVDLRLPGGKPGKDGAEALKAYGQSVAADTIVLMTCTQWGKAFEGAWVDALTAHGWYVPVWPLKRPDLPRWISARARTRNLVMDDEAIALLAERTEGNLLACAQEIDKLALMGESGRIGVGKLDSLLAEQSRLDVFALTDAVLAGDTPRALRIVRSLKDEGEPVVPIISWLGGQVELLARVAHAESRGGSLGQGLRAERVWDSRIALYEGALRRLGQGGCRRALLTLARVDRISKGRETGDVWLELERLILALSGAGRRRRAAA
jgi:DNA polymerase-3 subunit delta